MTWDVTLPLGSEGVSNGDDRIREFKVDVQTSLRANASEGTEAVFPGADSANPVFRYRGLKGTTGARPAATDHGLYMNETTNTIQRSTGAAWVDVATLIPSGTVMLFYQASVPTGWSAVAVNDRFLRVVSGGGSGGSTGGSGLAPSSTITLAHSHTVDGHTHSISSDGGHTHSTPNHTHRLAYTSVGGQPNGTRGNAPLTTDTSHVFSTWTGGGNHTEHQIANNITEDSGGSTTGSDGAHTHGGATGSASPGTNSQLSNIAFQYADVIIGTKD